MNATADQNFIMKTIRQVYNSLVLGQSQKRLDKAFNDLDATLDEIINQREENLKSQDRDSTGTKISSNKTFPKK